jgi:hypothetical protein
MAPNKEVVQSWEHINLRVVTGLSPDDIAKIEAAPPLEAAVHAMFDPDPTDFDVRLSNSIFLWAQAIDSDEEAVELPIHATILETLLRTPQEQQIGRTLQDRAVQLLKPKDAQALRDQVHRVYQGRSEMVHVRADQFARYEPTILGVCREGRVLAHVSLQAALRHWSKGRTFAEFLQRLASGTP